MDFSNLTKDFSKLTKDEIQELIEASSEDQPTKEKAIKLLNFYIAEREAALNNPEEWPPANRCVVKWKAHGLDCALATTSRGYCGYIHVPEEHPFERLYYTELPRLNFDYPITFRCKAVGGGSWFGFDTFPRNLPRIPAVAVAYKGKTDDLETVHKLTEDLARIFSEVKNANR